MLEEVEEWLDGLDGVTTVHAPFYDLSSRYCMVSPQMPLPIDTAWSPLKIVTFFLHLIGGGDPVLVWFRSRLIMHPTTGMPFAIWAARR